jgi:DNA-binding CsgD family transcriptional regulator
MPELQAPPAPDEVAARKSAHLVRCGAELVELSERFYRGIFLGLTAIVVVAAFAALALLPLRGGGSGPPLAGVIAGGLLVLMALLAAWHVEGVYRLVRRRQLLEVGIVLYAAALVTVVFPLRSQLWWPSCALLMLVAVVAPLHRVLAYCVAVLGLNLLSHVLTGDLGRTPAVSIAGLWIGYFFWSLTVAAISDQLAAHLLLLNSTAQASRAPARRVVSWIGSPLSDAASGGSDPLATSRDAPDLLAPLTPALASVPENDAAAEELPGSVERPALTERLTARQLQVLALLVDGLRYREIAACLSIAEGQVQRHVARAIARVGARSPAELVAIAVAEGFAPAPGADLGG